MTAVAERLRIGVVGTGTMGQHHVRILSELPRAHFVGLFDSNEEIAQGVARKYGTKAFASLDHLVAEVDAVVLSVPTVLHAEIGCRLLEQGLHLLVEKPIATSVDEADRLVERSADRVLAAGHVEFFNPAVEALLAQNSPPRFVVIERLSSFTRRSVDID
ncbi:MAG: Gfo/Idh/MocA family oxidoreductase, partial [Acidobacteria bacterium]|nr:Gfo/Idh/MocA family oxidoreductase [Acidobacteriota bacterium]